MKIAVDIRALQSHHKYRGIGTYTKGLVEALSRADHSNYYVYIIDPQLADPLVGLQIHTKHMYSRLFEPLPRSLSKYALRSLLRRPMQLSSYDIEILLQPDVELGLSSGGVKNYTVLYDLIPLLFPRHYFPSMRHPKSWLMSRLVYWCRLRDYQSSDGLFAISKSTRNDCVRFFPKLDTEKLIVEYIGYDGSPAIVQNSAAPVKGEYILYVGSCDYRKNITDLVESFHVIRASRGDVKLVLVGKDFIDAMPAELARLIAKSPYKEDIELMGYVSEEKKSSLFAHASAFAFPSLYEGFGLPILEAMCYNCPIVAYGNSSIPEVGGDAIYYAADANSLTEKLQDILMHPPNKDMLKRKYLRQLSKFSWDKMVKGYLRKIIVKRP